MVGFCRSRGRNIRFSNGSRQCKRRSPYDGRLFPDDFAYSPMGSHWACFSYKCTIASYGQSRRPNRPKTSFYFRLSCFCWRSDHIRILGQPGYLDYSSFSSGWWCSNDPRHRYGYRNGNLSRIRKRKSYWFYNVHSGRWSHSRTSNRRIFSRRSRLEIGILCQHHPRWNIHTARASHFG